MKSKIAILVALTMVLSLLVGCGATGDKTQDNEDKVLHIGTMSPWVGVDLSQLDSTFTSQELISDPLFYTDENGNLIPVMASAVKQSEDGLTITVTMPEDLSFHTGEKVLPEDIKYSIDRFRELSPMADQLAQMKSVEVNGQDVILTFDSFSSGILPFLSSNWISFVDKDVAEASNKDELLWGADPYGLYYLDTYVEGASVTLKRNEYYKTNNNLVDNKGVGYYDEIIVTFYADDFSLLTAINSGEVDMAFDCNSIADQIAGPDTTVVVGTPNVTIHYLTMNTHSGILQDELVREAIVYAVDREKMTADYDALTAEYSPLPVGLPCCTEDFAKEYKAKYGTDLEKAKGLLAQAGWKDNDGDGYVEKDGKTLELKYLCRDSEMTNNTAQTLMYSLQEIGIKMNIQAFANYGHYTPIAEGDYDIAQQQIGWFEPTVIASMLLWCDTGVMENYGKADELNALVGDLTTNPSAEARTQDTYSISKMVTEDLLLTPIYTENSFYVYNTNAAGLIDPVVGNYLFNDIKPQA